MEKLVEILSDSNTKPHRARFNSAKPGSGSGEPLQPSINQTRNAKKGVMSAEELLAWDPFRLEAKGTPEVDEDKSAMLRAVEENTERFLHVANDTAICDAAGRVIEITAHNRMWEEHIFDNLPATPGVESLKRQEVVALLLEEVRRNYFQSIGFAIATYHLMDPRFCSQNEVDPSLLDDPRVEWTSDEYTSDEWRVFRKTGMRHEGIVHAADALADNLHISKVLVQLQDLWNNRSVPCSGDDGTCAFVDIGTPTYQRLLPMDALAFVKHSETVADTVRKDLKQKWLSEAASLISNFVDNPAEEQTQENFATKLLNAASTLMSRQVRSSVDMSVVQFADFFDDYADSHNQSETTAIIIDLTLGEDKDSIVFSPTFEELKESLSACLDYVVGSARRLVSILFVGPYTLTRLLL